MSLSRRKMDSYMHLFLREFRRTGSHTISLAEPSLKSIRFRSSLRADLYAMQGMGYISVDAWPRDRAPSSFHLTPKGACYFLEKAAVRRSILLKSILIPILVAVITTVVSVYILPPLGRRVEAWLAGSSQSLPLPSPTPAPNCGLSENPEITPAPTISS